MNKKKEMKTFIGENNLIKNAERVRALHYNSKKHILTGIKD